jgi:short-subunit dehydrogenase
VQVRLTNLLLPMMLKREKRSSIVFITAQCMVNGSMWASPEISVPYLGVYEASNAFGFYHACSIYKEYGGSIDVMNVMPGAVITDNTSFLKDTIFAVKQDKFVKNIISMMGRVTGNTCGYWKHALSSHVLPNVSFIKDPIVEKVGKTIAKSYMEKSNEK